MSEIHPLRKRFRSLPSSFKGLLRSELRIGHIYELTDLTVSDREDLGLPSKPPTAYSDPNALEALKRIAKATNLKKDTGFDVDKLDFEW